MESYEQETNTMIKAGRQYLHYTFPLVSLKPEMCACFRPSISMRTTTITLSVDASCGAWLISQILAKKVRPHTGHFRSESGDGMVLALVLAFRLLCLSSASCLRRLSADIAPFNS